MSNPQNVTLKDRKGRKFGIVTVMSIMTIALIATVGVCFMYIQAYQQASNKQTETNQVISQLQTTNEKLLERINDQTLEIEGLKKTPVDTSGDALLERDIFVYIDKKFQLVPKTSSQEIANQIVAKARQEGVSPELVVGVIEVESAFNASAVSSANARGLMQVMPEWAPKFGLKKVSDLHDIDTGIECGIKVLKIHVDEEKGNLTKGLFKYVGGSDTYAGKVYTAMGKFVAYRSTIPDTEEKQE